MSGGQSADGATCYSERRAINLYRPNTLALWAQVEEAVRDEYDADSATQGELAAQAFADWLGTSGPLGARKNHE